MDIFNFSQEQKEKLNIKCITEDSLEFRKPKGRSLSFYRFADGNLKVETTEVVKLLAPTGYSYLNKEQLQVFTQWLSQLPNL